MEVAEKFLYALNKKNKERKKAIFFDRDGVLITDKHYIKKIEDVELIEGAKKAILKSKDENYVNIIITNQSGISRGFYSWDEYFKINQQMRLLMGEASEQIAAIYANGYINSHPSTLWRKPNPGMLLEAAKDFNLDLEISLIVGDRLTDLQAGLKAGISTFVHVETGHGIQEKEDVINWFNHLKTTEEKQGHKRELKLYRVQSIKELIKII